MKQWILLLCICLPLTVTAKHSKEYRDIMKQVNNMPDDTAKITMLLNLAETNIKERHGYSDRALYAQQALALADSLHFKKGTGNAYTTLGWLAGCRHAHALDYFSDALRIKTELKDTAGMGYVLYYTGRVYICKHEYSIAQVTLTQARNLLERRDDKPMMANTIAALGWTNGRCHNYAAAKTNLGTSIGIFEQLGNKRAEAQNIVHLAYVCKRDRAYADAAKKARKGKELALEIKDKKTVWRANHCLKRIPKQYRHQD